MSLWRDYAPELVTDLYEFTMAASYLKEGMSGEATFSLFVREYPENRAYFVSAGLEQLIDTICALRFSEESINYLSSLHKFEPEFLEALRRYRFTGTVRAIPEGRIFFCQEPLLEVTAPIFEAQIIETLAMNVLQTETLLASKAARCIQAARGKPLVDFGLRRTQGVDAGVKAARAGYLVGFAGTSNLLAGKLYDIPVFGTMAHSYVTSFPHEMDSFLAFVRAFPENTVLLIDTYDTLRGAEKALEVARILEAEGRRLIAVRLDSGDLCSLSKEVRRIFRQGGHPDIQIMASGSLDEYRIEQLLAGGAEIDSFAVGTRVVVSADAPYLDMAYKLTEYDGRPVLKLSRGKTTWVGRKQVYRRYDGGGRMLEDVLGTAGAERGEGEPLLVEVMKGGERVRPPETLREIRARFAREWETLPLPCRKTVAPKLYPVQIAPSLAHLQEETVRMRLREEVGRNS